MSATPLLLCDAETSRPVLLHNAPCGSLSPIFFQVLPEEVVHRCLRYALSLDGLAACAPVNKSLYAAAMAPESWHGVEVHVPTSALRRPNLVTVALASWQRCKCICLAVGPGRVAAANKLADGGFSGRLKVLGGHGPLPLFYMGHYPGLEMGQRLQLHFFEPRYRWMCRRLLLSEVAGWDSEGLYDLMPECGSKPPIFGFVTDPAPRGHGALGTGASGFLMMISSHHWNRDGTCDVGLVALQKFAVVEHSQEQVPDHPGAPPLHTAHWIRGPATNICAADEDANDVADEETDSAFSLMQKLSWLSMRPLQRVVSFSIAASGRTASLAHRLALAAANCALMRCRRRRLRPRAPS
eukprot:gnl/TRDRNA2_/TRDRNA2_165004_c4_seq1.p1 gnl/TRDRNA2_/TRDRNA2_165004_c4~~gnl/TRDRNA2_/TRDRNA2_165004_c4_seq1.p1  ORF type:complete len:384 (-),score=35.15 gnl/TRDRNA2_/TRDRNA2_165004_c4_seq1:145-1203(-)